MYMEDLFDQMSGQKSRKNFRKSAQKKSHRSDDLRGSALKSAMGSNFENSGEDYASREFFDRDHDFESESFGDEIDLVGEKSYVDLREEEDL